MNFEEQLYKLNDYMEEDNIVIADNNVLKNMAEILKLLTQAIETMVTNKKLLVEDTEQINVKQAECMYKLKELLDYINRK